MSVCEILKTKIDERKNGSDCKFNGYLEDFLSIDEVNLDATLKESFTAILASEPDTRIIVDLKSAISENAVSNQIIRYKDIFKLNTKPLVIPYILYLEKENVSRGMILLPYSVENYIYGKGMYYCETEPGGEFCDVKNELVSVSSKTSEEVVQIFQQMFVRKAGEIQRNLDKQVFTSYEELKKIAYNEAEKKKTEAAEVLPTLDDRTQAIFQYVVHWFLLKKVLYVQYMVNKIILKTEHDGNVKKQRNQAKINADMVSFLSFAEMWRMDGNQEKSDNDKQ